ncbi:hypothetical protein BLOT_011706 [Blomia tropicalis]|nr:hypothetical protein BLOT_011706 [Blomia tropicalis]
MKSSDDNMNSNQRKTKSEKKNDSIDRQNRELFASSTKHTSFGPMSRAVVMRDRESEKKELRLNK